MKAIFLFMWVLISIFLLFAKGKVLPLWVHHFCSIGLDKPAHAIIFGGLMYGWLSVDKTGNEYYIALIISLIGLNVEFMQHYYANGRAFSWTDEIANISGVLIVLILFKLKIF